MSGIFISLGSNLNNRLSALSTAAKKLQQHASKIIDESSIYETAAWGDISQPHFLNVVLSIETSLDPTRLIDVCLQIEHEMGRLRTKKYGARNIDIDILYYHNQVIDSVHLKIPHPHLSERKFVLLPLVELCPFKMHPTLQQNHLNLLADCKDMLDCNLTDLRLNG